MRLFENSNFGFVENMPIIGWGSVCERLVIPFFIVMFWIFTVMSMILILGISYWN